MIGEGSCIYVDEDGIRCAEQAHEVRLPAKYVGILSNAPLAIQQKPRMVRFFACDEHEKELTEEFDEMLAEKKRGDDVQFA